MDKVLSLVDSFARDARLYVILGLIALDVLFAVARAIKERRFELVQLATFYETMIVPFLIGYLALYVVVGLSIGVEQFFGQVAVSSAFGTIALHLVGSVVRHAKAIGFTFEPKNEYPDVPEM